MTHTKETKPTLTIEGLSQLDSQLSEVQLEIKNLNNTKKVLVRDILNLTLKEIKQLKELDEYKTFSKKGLATIVSIKLDTKLTNPNTKKIVKSVFIFISSKSSLDIDSLSVSKFNRGMSLINKGLYYRFKSNDELEQAIKEEDEKKLIEKVAKLNK